MTPQLDPAQQAHQDSQDPRPTGRRRRLHRALATGAAAVALVVAPAAAASAHVHVVPGSTAEGSYATLTFRVPTESDTASTTKLVVTLPTGTPLVSVSTRPVPGWTATVEQVTLPAPVDVAGTTITKAPGTVTWTAEPGAAIAPGQFQEFELSAGPLPAAGTELVFPAVQTYSDGSVVRWDQPSTGAQEPEHPAPAFTVTAAAGAGSGGGAGAGAHPTAAAAPAPAAAAVADTTARTLGGTGLALGVVAVLLALAGLLRQRRAPSAADRVDEPGGSAGDGGTGAAVAADATGGAGEH